MTDSPVQKMNNCYEFGKATNRPILALKSNSATEYPCPYSQIDQENMEFGDLGYKTNLHNHFKLHINDAPLSHQPPCTCSITNAILCSSLDTIMDTQGQTSAIKQLLQVVQAIIDSIYQLEYSKL